MLRATRWMIPVLLLLGSCGSPKVTVNAERRSDNRSSGAPTAPASTSPATDGSTGTGAETSASSEAGRGITEEQEPNNEFKNANWVSSGQSFSTSIHPKGDADVFRIKVDEPGYVRLRAANVPEGFNLMTTWHTYDQWDGAKPLKGQMKIPNAVHVAKAGVVYVRLYTENDWHASRQPFTVQIDALPEVDAGEMNDTYETATALTAGQTQRMAIYPRGDQDWFVFEAEQRGYLRVQLRDVPENLNMMWQVRKASTEWGAEPEVVRSQRQLPDGVHLAEPGKYFLQLYTENNWESSLDIFALRPQFLPEFDAQEMNDTPRTAHAIQSKQPLDIAIYPRGDRDWFAFEATEPGYLKLAARDVPEPLNLMWVVHETPEHWDQELACVRGQHRLPDAVHLTQPGKYLLQVYSENDWKAEAETFSVRPEFRPEFDPQEPNNTAAQATPVRPATPVSMAIFPTGDSDWFKVVVTQKGEIKASVRNVPDELNLMWRVYQEGDGDEVREVTGQRGIEDPQAVSEAGDYLLRVYSENDWNASEQLFELKFDGPLQAPEGAAAPEEDDDGQASAPTPSPATVESFTANPKRVVRGQDVTLRWETDHAGTVWIETLPEGPIHRDLPQTGSLQVKPEHPEMRYRLTAFNPYGEQKKVLSPTLIEPTIVMVPGWRSGPRAMDEIRQRCERHRFKALVWNIPDRGARSTIPTYARELKRFLDEKKPASPDDLTLVGYSMGGLICRYYVQELGGKARQVISVCTPHHGTAVAHLPGPSPSKKNMRLGSPFIRKLHEGSLPDDAAFHAIWLTNDGVVMPHHSARLPGATNYQMKGPVVNTHVRAPKDPQIAEMVASIVSGRANGRGPQGLSDDELKQLGLK